MSFPSISDYFDELYPTLDPTAREAHYYSHRIIETMRLGPIRKIYWRLREAVGIPKDFDDADIYETAWAEAENIFDKNGSKPLTSEELDEIWLGNARYRGAMRNLTVVVMKRRIKPIREIYERLRDDYIFHEVTYMSNKLREVIWNIAKDLHENGDRPLTSREFCKIDMAVSNNLRVEKIYHQIRSVLRSPDIHDEGLHTTTWNVAEDLAFSNRRVPTVEEMDRICSVRYETLEAAEDEDFFDQLSRFFDYE